MVVAEESGAAAGVVVAGRSRMVEGGADTAKIVTIEKEKRQ